MAETDFAEFEGKTANDRTVMHVLYGLHVAAPFTYWTLAIVAMIVNYVKRSDEHDAVYSSHHNYMISTFWWSILWLVLTAPLYLLLLLPGVIAHVIVGIWYLYRCIRGWMRFADYKPPF
ncbi:MAG: DUF4870 family protein [Ramlibacter sp.]|nr:hypothetical protein [Ramlibacter sp.]